GARDPDPRVDGRGIAALRAHGIEVVEGVLADEAAEAVAAFSQRVRAGRPLVTLKLASTLDGRIATRAGESRWITGPEARRVAHALRGCHDAVMVGVGTVRADDPDLTCRIAGMRALPVVRVVADSALRTSFSSRLMASASEAPVWLLVSPGADPARCAEAEDRGARVIAVDPHPDPLPRAGEGEDFPSPSPPLGEEGRGEGGRTLHLPAALLALGAAGLTSVLVEGGARLAASLLRADLVDRIAWFHAPALMGGDGLPAVRAMGHDRLADLPRFRRHSASPIGDDMLTTFERAS
ncbi:MAG TPA: dihydrofolate reductase family protein, partial [Acetobacteraceae bacterium]|nr:dihydrofolate reductase family protein [Acetobacteraceae bacterium]